MCFADASHLRTISFIIAGNNKSRTAFGLALLRAGLVSTGCFRVMFRINDRFFCVRALSTVFEIAGEVTFYTVAILKFVETPHFVSGAICFCAKALCI